MKTSSQSKLGYVVVGWNNLQFLDKCLGSIEVQEEVQKTIFYVDNASEDGSTEFVANHFSKVKIIKNKANFGFAKANNIGIRHAIKNGADYVVLLNTDAELTPSWSRTIVNFAKTHPKGACFQGITLRKKEKDKIDSTGIYLDKNLVATQTNYMVRYNPPYSNCEVFGVNAAAALYTAEFLKYQPFKEQYFDEDFFMYLEDVDLSLRALELGYKNYSIANATAYHIGSASSKSQKFAYKLSYKNHLAMLYKNFSVGFIFKHTPRLIVSDLTRMRDFYRLGQKDVTWAILTGRLSSIRLLFRMHKKRHLLVKGNKEHFKYINSQMQSGYITLGK